MCRARGGPPSHGIPRPCGVVVVGGGGVIPPPVGEGWVTMGRRWALAWAVVCAVALVLMLMALQWRWCRHWCELWRYRILLRLNLQVLKAFKHLKYSVHTLPNAQGL